MLSLLFIAAGAFAQPAELVYVSDDALRPCRQHVDPPGITTGYPFKTGTYDCTYVLTDAANSDATVSFYYSFKKSGLAPVPEDLRKSVLPALTLLGPVVSYYEPTFDDAAQFIVMPTWRDSKQQDMSVLGYDWPPAPDSTHGVKCEVEGPDPYCRAILPGRMFIHVTFKRQDEPLDATYRALAIFVSEW